MAGSKELQSEIDRYELTSDQLFSFIGLTDTEAVRARLRYLSFPTPESSIRSDYLIREWGITLDQLFEVIKLLKTKVKPDPKFVARFNTTYLLELAPIEFINAWKEGRFEKAEIIYINSEDMLTATKVLSLYRQINTHVIPRSQI